jgi:hypothetical protein
MEWQADMAKRKNQVVAETMPLWPDAGQALGLGKNLTYAAAKRGEIPGLMRFGRSFKVARAPFRRALEEGHKPADKK